MNFPEKYLVYDIRTIKDLKNSTISGYKKNDVLLAFESSLLNRIIEDSIKWCVELHISCYDKDIWKTFFQFYLKNIHINNPKLLIYLLKRKKTYDKFLMYMPKQHYLFSRNNIEIRNMFAELTAFLNNSPKSNLLLNKSLPSIQIKKLNADELKKRMVAINNTEIEQFLYSDTHNIIKLCLNEIYMHLKMDKTNININNCFFWYLYLEKNKDIQKIEENKKMTTILHFFEEENKNNISNNNNDDNDKLKTHWTFILWNIIFYFKKNLSKYDNILIDKLELLYKKNFKISQIGSKKYIFLYCFLIIKKHISWKKPLIYNEHIYIQSNANINNMYLNLLKNIYKYLNEEQQDLYFKKYYKIINDYLPKDDTPKQSNIIDINENLNKILYNQHNFISNIKQNEKNEHENNLENVKNNLINKNKTLKDIQNEKDEKLNKKLDLFVNCFIQKKNKSINKPNFTNNPFSKNKSVIDYYQNDIIYNQNDKEYHKEINYDVSKKINKEYNKNTITKL